MKKYMVMECHLSYAVVLAEDGRFLKVANLNYEVGQTVTDIVEMQLPQQEVQKKKSNKWIYTITAMAACLVLMAATLLHMGNMTYASVYVTINPEVRIDVNRRDIVVGVDGVNQDGKNLLEGYTYKKKNLDTVMDELVDRAIDMGYLHEGGKISIVLDASNDEWIVSHSDTITVHLNDYVSEKIAVTIDVTDKNKGNSQIVIPVSPEESDYGDSAYGESDYGQSDYKDSTDGETGYDEAESDYDDDEDEDSDDGYSNYGDSDDNIAEGESGYYGGDTDYGEDDSQSEYQQDDSQSDYDTDGQTDYGEEDSESDYLTEDSYIESEGTSDYDESQDNSQESEDESDYDSEDDDDDDDSNDSSDYETEED